MYTWKPVFTANFLLVAISNIKLERLRIFVWTMLPTNKKKGKTVKRKRIPLNLTMLFICENSNLQNLLIPILVKIYLVNKYELIKFRKWLFWFVRKCSWSWPSARWYLRYHFKIYVTPHVASLSIQDSPVNF